MKKVRIVLWSAVVVAAAVSATLWMTERGQGPTTARVDPEAESFAADFELTDHTGMVQTDEDFRGRWMLVFFGFANCPDVCPMGLATIAQVMDDLGTEGAAVQPLFITVDPERDTPGALADYVPQFGPGILGLSGSPDQIERTAETFKIYYQKTEEASSPDGYTIGHTSSFLLFDPEGEFVRIYEYDQEPGLIVADLRERIGT
ncbi:MULTISPECIES: SCO family protein [Sulfitobacter]|jgi:protein SCO1/2|uniref:SCO family protein n=2 Tax=Roseobacteraceae TaxID=2854170 RepID=UPI000B563A9C|nr:electron transport protein SCO1/SenC [Rhodobacterales bacterium 59_46_T64]|tara:strand:+ start:7021 stop:7629 length:609 start_codon:yes stop_codon:yes gene_type:complete